MNRRRFIGGVIATLGAIAARLRLPLTINWYSAAQMTVLSARHGG